MRYIWLLNKVDKQENAKKDDDSIEIIRAVLQKNKTVNTKGCFLDPRNESFEITLHGL